jgi:uncharacterized membrane protein (DUF4010 family)
MIDDVWLRFVAALCIGLLVGVERERSKGIGPTRREAGIRTFALASILGALAFHIGGGLLLAAVFLIVGALTVVAYFRRQGEDPGLTTEIGLLATVLLGGLALTEPGLAAGLGVGLAVLLASKATVHGFVRDVLSKAELNDAFILAFATIVVWPLLPDRPMGPLDAINPHKIWSLVVLVMAVGAAGHIASRVLGGTYGLPLSGFAAGFASSTATIGAMGQRAKNNPDDLRGAVAGAALSTVATFVQMALLLAVACPPVAVAMAPALVAGGVVAAIYGLLFTWAAVRGQASNPYASGSAFSLNTALVLAATLSVMLVVTAFLQQRLGESGVLAGAALAGFADTHAAAISIASLANAGKFAPAETIVPILAAMTCNGITKVVMALSAGAPSFGLRVGPGIVLSLAAAWLVAIAGA